MIDPIIFYMHLPKTAGITIQNLVSRQYKEGELLYFYQQDKIDAGFSDDNAKAIIGHYRFGFHKNTNKPYKYVAIMRNPVEQIISHYYYLYNFDHERFDDVRAMTLEEFAESKYAYNFQTRFISGVDDIKADPEKYLELAKENIRNHFLMVGLTERLDESVVLMKNVLGYKRTFYNSGNINKKRKKKNEISDTAIEAVKANCLMDQKLYAFVKQRFDEQIKNVPDFEKQLNTHLVANKWFQKLDPYYIKYKRLTGKL